MFKALYNALLEWNRNSDNRQKMQHAYLTIAIVSLLACGLISILDVNVGRDLLIVPAGAAAVFVANSIVWSLLDSVIVGRLSGRHKK